jgi:hypothetical protein
VSRKKRDIIYPLATEVGTRGVKHWGPAALYDMSNEF